MKVRHDAAKRSVGENLCVAFSQVARIEGQSVVSTTLPDAKPVFVDHLREAWKHIVEEEEWVLRKVGTVTLQKAGLIITEGSTRVRDAIECFLRYSDKPMIASKDAVLEGLAQACREKLIGIGRGMDTSKLQKKVCGEDIMLDPNEDGLWIIPPFAVEPVSTPTMGSTAPAGTGTPSSSPNQTAKPGQLNVGASAGAVAKTARRVAISGTVPVESWADVFRCFVSPSVRLNPKRLSLGIDFEMAFGDDQHIKLDEPTIKAIKEAAKQLGLTIQIEE